MAGHTYSTQHTQRTHKHTAAYGLSVCLALHTDITWTMLQQDGPALITSAHAGGGAGAGRVGRDGTAVVRIRRHPGASSPLFSVSSLLSSLFSASLSSLSPLLFLSTLLSPLSSSASKLCLLSLLCLLSFLLFSSSLISLLCLLSRLILYLLIHI